MKGSIDKYSLSLIKQQVVYLISINQFQLSKYSPVRLDIQISYQYLSTLLKSNYRKMVRSKEKEASLIQIPYWWIIFTFFFICNWMQQSTREWCLFSFLFSIADSWFFFCYMNQQSIAWLIIVILHLKHVFFSSLLSLAYLHNIFLLFFHIDSTLLFNTHTFSAARQKHTYLWSKGTQREKEK
jgi:hypothetical protein